MVPVPPVNVKGKNGVKWLFNLKVEGGLEWDPKDEGSLLGEGAFGSVYRGTLNYQEVAIKVIKRTNDGAGATIQHAREIRRLMMIPPHPCITQFFGYAVDSASEETLIVTEVMDGGSLHDSLTVMRNRGTPADGGAVLDESSFLRVGRSIASGLLHIHLQNVTHGDMKPHNVLLDSSAKIEDSGMRASFRRDVRAKLTDFGLSRRTTDFFETTNTSDFGQGPVGTFAYMAPEAFDGIANQDGNVAKAADVYAFAVVMYELLCGRQPWIVENVKSVWTLHRMVCTEMRRPSWGPRRDKIRTEYVEMVEKCWAQNYKDRPTALEIAKQFKMWMDVYRANKSTPRTPDSASSVSEGKGTSSDTVDQTASDKESSPASPDSYTAADDGGGVGAPKAGETASIGDSLELGSDEDGAPIVHHVVSKVLNEKETLAAVLNIGTPNTTTDDIGASTDTRMDDSRGGDTLQETEEPSEYDESEVRFPEKLEITAATSSQSLSDFTAELGCKVRRVQSQAIPLPPRPSIALPINTEVVPMVVPEKVAVAVEKKENPGLLDSFFGAIQRENKANDMAPLPKPAPPVPPQFPDLITSDLSRPSPQSTVTDNANTHSPARPDQGAYNLSLQLSSSIVSNASPPQAQQMPPYRAQPSYGWGSPQQMPAIPSRHGTFIPNMHLPHQVQPQYTIRDAFNAIQGPNPRQALDLYWNAPGHAHVIAQAFVQGATQSPPLLTGKLYLDLALEYINRNNMAGPKQSRVARDLCLTVGSLASSQAFLIDKATAQQALPITLCAIQSFQNDAAVYSTCCFAMSNLLQISNHIDTAALRKEVAVWIVHAISWNLREKKQPSLAYTATCAARNLMWLNEANATAFLSKTVHFNASPLAKLLTSMNEFLSDDNVLNVTLSALSMVAYFPRLRVQFAHESGIAILANVLRQIVHRMKTAAVCLSLLGCVVSEPGTLHKDDYNALSNALLSGDLCGAVLHALHFSLPAQQANNVQNGDALRLMDEALATLSAICEFNADMRATFVDKNAVGILVLAAREFSATLVSPVRSALQSSCVVQLCDAACTLAKSGAALKLFQESQLALIIKNVCAHFASDSRVVECCNNTVSVLT